LLKLDAVETFFINMRDQASALTPVRAGLSTSVTGNSQRPRIAGSDPAKTATRDGNAASRFAGFRQEMWASTLPGVMVAEGI